MIPLPDPPLRSGDLLLRPWRLGDAPALVAAWADEEVQRWIDLPADRDVAAAERWIAGDDERRRRRLSIDLVVERSGEVAGEVGLARFDPAGATVEIGWWTAAAHRGRGVASTAVALVARWSEATLGLAPIAACDPANAASVAVAHRAGVRVARGPLLR